MEKKYNNSYLGVCKNSTQKGPSQDWGLLAVRRQCYPLHRHLHLSNARNAQDQTAAGENNWSSEHQAVPCEQNGIQLWAAEPTHYRKSQGTVTVLPWALPGRKMKMENNRPCSPVPPPLWTGLSSGPIGPLSPLVLFWGERSNWWMILKPFSQGCAGSSLRRLIPLAGKSVQGFPRCVFVLLPVGQTTQGLRHRQRCWSNAFIPK